MNAIKFDILGQLEIKKRLQLLQLPASKRRQFLGGFGREIKRQTARNLRAGKDVDGKAWEPRKRGKNRRLLRRLNRQIEPVFATPDSVQISFKGIVARQQHDGFTKAMNAAEMIRENGKGKTQDVPASAKQAKSLRAAGFKVRVQGAKKKWRSPSLSWIRQNMSQQQAGLVLKILRGDESKTSWITKIPARGFLGLTEAQINSFVNTIFDNTINSRV
jgi:Phage virion morphogenesis family